MSRKHTRRSKNPRSLRNLTLRLPAPTKGNGRIQKACLRSLWALGEASTSEIMQWACCMKLHRGDRVFNHDYRTCRRALAAIGAIKIGRAKTIGRPWIWSAPPDATPANDE